MEKQAKQPRKSGKKWILFLGIALVVVAAGGVFIYTRLQTNSSATSTSYTTQAVKKGDLSSTVSATGNVYTRQTVSLSWQTSGIVSQVSVAKGQQVIAGDVLAELDQASLPQSVLSAATDLASAQQALDDLLNSNTSRANAELALITAEQNLVNAQKTAQSKLYQRASQTTIDTAKANLIQAQAALDQASAAYNANKNRSSDDVQYAAALSRFASAQQTYDTAQMNYQYVQSMPDALSVESANASVDVAQAAYDDAKRAWEKVKDGPNPVDVAAAQAKVAAAQALLDEAKITAPIGGTVTVIDTQVGDLVSGQTVAFQIDDMAHLYVDLSVSEIDINNVQVGQPVAVTFDAISNKTYTGKVTDVSMIGSSSSGSVNYTVTAELTGADAQVRPGMTASATITVNQKNGVLLVPSSAIRTVNNQQVIYVMQNSALRPVVITTGDTSDTYTEVTSNNLQEGDEIVMNPPSTTTSATTMRSGGLLGGLFGGVFGGGSGPIDGGAGGPPTGGPGGQFPSGSSGSSRSSGSSSGSQSSGGSSSSQ